MERRAKEIVGIINQPIDINIPLDGKCWDTIAKRPSCVAVFFWHIIHASTCIYLAEILTNFRLDKLNEQCFKFYC